MFRLASLVVITASIGITPAEAQTESEWQAYVNPTFGTSAALPLGAFAVVPSDVLLR